MTEKKVFETFKLPIEHLQNKYNLDDNLIKDLELIKTNDGSENSIYSYLFKPKTTLGKECLTQWGKYYTPDKQFLKETQKILKEFKPNIQTEIVENAYKDWREIKKTSDFCEKYQYIEWERIKGINRYSTFLTFLSYYNLSAPLFNLALPIIILIIPFFILKMTKVPITWNAYYTIVTMQIKNHIIGKIYYNFRNIDWNQRMYYLFSFGIYLYNIYQNIISCYRFYKNTYKISNYFLTLQKYIKYTVQNMQDFNSIINKFKTYQTFSQEIDLHQSRLQDFYDEIITIQGKILSMKKFAQIGFVMKQFFILYDDIQLEKSFLFSFGFNGYMDTLSGLKDNINQKFIAKAKYINSKLPIVKFKKSYYPTLINQDHIKNNIDLSQNMILTGPNAAGKTTLIKSTLLNILFSQQVGFGFFKKAQITPFDYIHAYINIPDTVSRDSLFQAEARRCKQILDTIELNPQKKHFCIFDELYSGTNPYEAIGSAYSYLHYMNGFKNVKYMLTTHFIKLCTLFENDKKTTNYNMQTKMIDEKAIYSYKLIKGYSTIRGGICVLRELRYPYQILRSTKKIMRSL